MDPGPKTPKGPFFPNSPKSPGNFLFSWSSKRFEEDDESERTECTSNLFPVGSVKMPFKLLLL